jgi:hypothetical protein
MGLFSRSFRHADIERHFSGAASSADDRRMWKHVTGCARCRAEYRTLSMLEAMEPGGADRARERMARGVFAPEAPQAQRKRLFAGAGLTAAFACFALVLILRNEPASFQERGGLGAQEAPAPTLAIYRVPRDTTTPERLAVGEAQRAGSLMHAGESLAFAYLNPSELGEGYLMVFGRDAAGHVYWFWPAWNDASENPASLPIQATPTGAAPVELTEAVRHPLTAGPLTVVGLFTPRALHVREVEAAVANGFEGLQAFPGHVWTETLEVTP